MTRSRFFWLLFLSLRKFSILSLKKRRSVYLQVFASSVQLCITSLRKSSPIIFAGIFFFYDYKMIECKGEVGFTTAKVYDG